MHHVQPNRCQVCRHPQRVLYSFHHLRLRAPNSPVVTACPSPSDQTQQYSITMAITDGILIKVGRRRSPLPLPESRLSSAVVDAFSEQH